MLEAATGAEALSTVAGGGIDLVVLDVRLPDMTGFEVCREIKDHHGRHSIPVMHVSAAAVDAVDRTQGLQGGADAYLVEPIDPDELLATSTLWRRSGWPDGNPLRVLVLRPRVDRPPLYVAVAAAATMPGNPVLMLFGQQLTSALDTTRAYAQEHHLALTLQRSLLPQTLPSVAGYDVAVRYLPASLTAEIGGDFYEAVQLDDTLMVAVGDVGGHSLHAATIMAEVRHATRAYLTEGHQPAGVLDRLNSLMCRLLPGETATMCLVAIDLADGRARLANAGHPPPVLRTRDGVRLVCGASPLLGIRTRPPTEAALTLEPDDLLLLYTDGLIETRTEPIDVNLARLVDAVTHAESDLEAFASRLLRDVGPQTASDDIAMVALRRTRAETEGSRPWPS